MNTVKFYVLVENKEVHFDECLPDNYERQVYIKWVKGKHPTMVNSGVWRLYLGDGYCGWILGDDPFSTRRIKGDNSTEVVLKIVTKFRNWDHFDKQATQDLFDSIVPTPYVGNFPYPRLKRIRQIRDVLNKLQDPCKIEQIAEILSV